MFAYASLTFSNITVILQCSVLYEQEIDIISRKTKIIGTHNCKYIPPRNYEGILIKREKIIIGKKIKIGCNSQNMICKSRKFVTSLVWIATMN